MCMDPLGRAHLNVLEAIQLIADDVKRHATHDPGVAEAVLVRLRDAETQLREVQAGFSRKESWRVIRKVSMEVAFEVLHLLIRATATHCNSVLNPLPQVRNHVAWHYYPKVPVGERLVTSRARPAGSCICVLPFSSRTGQARAHVVGVAAHRRSASSAFRRRAGYGPWGLHS